MDIQKEKWGSVKEFVKSNFHKIEEQITHRKASDVFREFEASSGFIAKSLQQSYECERTKRLTPTSKKHENRKLTVLDESLLVGYLLMRSEMSNAAN
jgi:hypothetical protein